MVGYLIAHLNASTTAAPADAGAGVDDPKERFARLRYKYATESSGLTTDEAAELASLIATLGIDGPTFEADVDRIAAYNARQKEKARQG